MNVSGGSLTVLGSLNVGNSGTGTFIQSGGVVSQTGANNSFTIGQFPNSGGGVGSYSLTGGSLNTQFEWVGYGGTGSFTQSGGTNSSLQVEIGYECHGSYTLSGSGLLTTPGEFVGYDGFGSFTQTGGTNTTSNLGFDGAYALNGSGLLTATYESVDNIYGYGSVTQTGGTNAMSGNGDLAVYGAYALGGSGLLTAPQEYIGYPGVYSVGTFTQTGGTNTVTGGLFLSGSSQYNLSGGLLTAGTISLGAQTGFTQTGGTCSPANIVYGGGNNLYSLSGGALIGTVAVGAQVDLAQTGGTVGPGTLVNSGTFGYSGGVFNGRLVNGGTFLFSTSFYAGGGIENDATIAVPTGFVVGTKGGSSTLDNEATITLAGGTLAGGQAAGSDGPIVNNGLITGYGALSSGVGIINNVQISPSGGILVISAGTAGMTNNGTITLASGSQLRLSGSTLTNLGTVNLNSSTVGGSGLLNNTSGNVSGPGTIIVPFQNAALLTVPAGNTNITQPFVNTGTIELTDFAAELTGGSIANSYQIQGFGLVAVAVNNTGTIDSLGGPLTVSGPVTNTGSIEAISGGLALSGPVTNTGTIEAVNGTTTITGSLQNNATALLAADAGSKLLVSSGLAANYGTISLTGGIFDNNSLALSNSGEITGYGTFRSGGLTNYNAVTFTGATSTINGPVTNASGGTINIFYNPAIFTGNVVNDGYVKATSTSVTWAGGFTNNGTYHSDPAQNYFSSLANGAAGLVLGGAGDGFFVTGPLATNAGDIDLGGTSTMVVDNGTGVLAQTSGTLEVGTGAALSAGSVEINGGILLADGPAAVITANLIYASSSTSTYQGILAGAGNTLTVDNPLATLVLSGTGNSYSGGTFVTAGELVVTGAGGIESGTALGVGNDLAAFGAVVPAEIATQSSMPVPEPAALALIAFTACIAVLYRKCRR